MLQNSTDFNAVLNLADDSVEVTSVESLPDRLNVYVHKKQKFLGFRYRPHGSAKIQVYHGP